MTTICVQNTHSWFMGRKAADEFLWTGTKNLSLPAIELFLTLNDNLQLESLKFSDMEKLQVTNNGKGGIVSFNSTERLCHFIERLFAFTGTSELVSPDLSLSRVRDLLYDLEIQLFLSPESSGPTTEKKANGKAVCILEVSTCQCNLGHCDAVLGWRKTGPLKTVLEILSGFDCSSDYELVDEFCKFFLKPEEKDLADLIRSAYLDQGELDLTSESLLTSEEEKWIYQRLIIFLEAKKRERWVKYPDSVFLHLKPIEKIPTLPHPRHGARIADFLPTDELDPENETYIEFNYSQSLV